MPKQRVTSNLDNAAENFQKDGYVFIPDFWTARQTACMLDNLDRYVREVLPSLPENAAMYAEKGNAKSLFRLEHMDQHDDWFDRLNHDDRLTSLMRKLLNDELVYQRVAFFGKLPHGGEATPPHQDGYYFKLTPNEAITCWMPLDICDEENGCMRYIPGSHRLPIREHGASSVYGFSQGVEDYGPDDMEAEVPIPCKPGDLLLHHSLTIHRADINNSARNRRSLGLVYLAARAKPDEEALRRHKEKAAMKWKELGKV